MHKTCNFIIKSKSILSIPYKKNVLTYQFFMFLPGPQKIL